VKVRYRTAAVGNSKGKERKVFNVTTTKENMFTANKYVKEVE
jgi:hypothetical protein